MLGIPILLPSSQRTARCLHGYGYTLYGIGGSNGRKQVCSSRTGYFDKRRAVKRNDV